MEEEDQFLAKESETLCRAPKSVLKGCLISYLEVKKIKNILQYRVLLLLCPSLGGGWRSCPTPLLFSLWLYFFWFGTFQKIFLLRCWFVFCFSFRGRGTLFILLFLFAGSYRHLLSLFRCTWEMVESSSLKLLASSLWKLQKEYVTQTPSRAQNHWAHPGDSPEISGFYLSTLVFYWNAGKSICQSLSVCTRFCCAPWSSLQEEQ